GLPLPGGLSAELTLPRVTDADDYAEFRCVITNSQGSTRSRRAILRVLPLQDPVRPIPCAQGLDCKSDEARGFLDILEEGVYTFFVPDAVPTKLFVGATEVSGPVALKAGKHRFRFLSVNGQRPTAQNVEYAGPGFARRPIPAARFFRP